MIQITWLGHATFELRFDSGEVLVMDPWIEGNPAYPKGYKIQKVDAIALSHAHFDHVNDVIPLSKKFAPKLVAIFETASWFEKRPTACSQPQARRAPASQRLKLSYWGRVHAPGWAKYAQGRADAPTL